MGATAVIGGIGSAINAAQGIGSGIAGKQAGNALEKKLTSQEGVYSQYLNQAGDTLNTLTDQADQFNNPVLRQQVTDQARGLGSQLSDIARSSADQLGRVGAYDFNPVQGTLASTMAAQDAFGARARAQAADQAALSGQASMDALDAALAGRGISRNSGVATSGLAQLAARNQQSMVGLNRDLANQASQSALQAAQFDNQNALQMAQLGSQYNLGRAQLSNQEAVARNDMLSNAANQGFTALANTYQNNYLNPYVQALGLASGLAGQLGSTGMSGLSNAGTIRAEGVKSAGGGKGAGIGSAISGANMLTSNLTPKGGSGPGGGGGGMPGFGVRFQ